jgi:GNAT superfamily N-acetyltransferase
MLTYTAADEWPEAWSKVVVDGLTEFNADHYVVASERKLSVAAVGEDGAVVGGLLGRTDHGWLYVGWLWVSNDHRGNGVGATLMERAEAMARDRGCHHAHLTTLEFQASEFYERMGYRIFGVLDDYPKPYRRFFLQKELRPTKVESEPRPSEGDGA